MPPKQLGVALCLALVSACTVPNPNVSRAIPADGSGGWLATHIAIMEGAAVRQAEDYSDWRGNVPLSNDFFVAEKWSDTRHWFRGT